MGLVVEFDEDDKKLLFLANTGNTSAEDALLRKYCPIVYAFHLTRVKKREDALDLTQETCLRAHRELAGFDPCVGTFKGWILKIACNQDYDLWRRLARVRKYWGMPVEVDRAELFAATDLDGMMLQQELFREIERLDEFYRRLVGLLLAELTSQEAATAMKLPLRTFEKYKSKVLEYLHAVMTQDAPKPAQPKPPRRFQISVQE